MIKILHFSKVYIVISKVIKSHLITLLPNYKQLSKDIENNDVYDNTSVSILSATPFM